MLQDKTLITFACQNGRGRTKGERESVRLAADQSMALGQNFAQYAIKFAVRNETVEGGGTAHFRSANFSQFDLTTTLCDWTAAARLSWFIKFFKVVLRGLEGCQLSGLNVPGTKKSSVSSILGVGLMDESPFSIIS